MSDLRDSEAGRILRDGVLRPPLEPHPLAKRAAAPGLIRDTLIATTERLRLHWERAPATIAGALRKERRLGSHERRFVADLLWELVRLDRLLERLLEGHGGALARVLALLVLRRGLPAELAEQRWDEAQAGAPIDWSALTDPEHALTGWLLDQEPSAAEVLGVVASLPTWLCARLLADRDDAVSLALSLRERAPFHLRVNTLRTTREAVLAELKDAGIPAEPLPGTVSGLLLGRRIGLQGLPAFRAGRIEAQDAGSQRLVRLVDMPAGGLIVDACAGAGGKTLALAALLEGRGRIIACDLRPEALEELKKRARRAGVDNVQATPTKARGRFPKSLRGLHQRVDCVLVDAPCTGTGALRRNPERRWSISPLLLRSLPKEQLAILDRFAPLVRPGGQLIYATCSLLQVENEAVIERFLGTAAGARFSTEGAPLRLRPDRDGTDGFFAVSLRAEG